MTGPRTKVNNALTSIRTSGGDLKEYLNSLNGKDREALFKDINAAFTKNVSQINSGIVNKNDARSRRNDEFLDNLSWLSGVLSDTLADPSDNTVSAEVRKGANGAINHAWKERMLIKQRLSPKQDTAINTILDNWDKINATPEPERRNAVIAKGEFLEEFDSGELSRKTAKELFNAVYAKMEERNFFPDSVSDGFKGNFVAGIIEKFNEVISTARGTDDTQVFSMDDYANSIVRHAFMGRSPESYPSLSVETDSEQIIARAVCYLQHFELSTKFSNNAEATAYGQNLASRLKIGDRTLHADILDKVMRTVDSDFAPTISATEAPLTFSASVRAKPTGDVAPEPTSLKPPKPGGDTSPSGFRL